MTIEKALEIAKMQGDRIMPLDTDAQTALLMLILCTEAVKEILDKEDADNANHAPEYWDGWYKAIGIVQKHVGKLDETRSIEKS